MGNSKLITKDNSTFQLIDSNDIENLKEIANVKIGALRLEDCPNLLVFPRDLNQYGDNIGNEPICTVDTNSKTLTTGNIMGFVGRNQTQLTIRSRFGNSDKEDYFMHYLLQKVFSINMFDLKHAINQDSVFDFLLYLFPYMLKKALAQGVYKEYQNRQYNDANLRGVVDVSRHIRYNIPFNGKIAYHTREYVFDNSVNQLIRHTIEYIRRKPMASRILTNNLDTRNAVTQIVQITPSYNRNNLQKIINQNIKPMHHAYYLAYRPLQKLCMQILHHENIKYGRQKDEIYGVLFDGAWLWEEYLFTILKEKGFHHPQNKVGKGGIYLFEKEVVSLENHSRCKRYPDFMKADFILDAKYKHLDNGIIARDDMHQIISYMHVEKASNGGFIYPSENTYSRMLGELRGHGGKVYNYGMQIAKDATSFADFSLIMKKNEECLKDSL